MKNVNSYFSKLAFMVALSSTVFYSCDKVDNPTPVNVIDTTKMATITGVVKAELDTTSGMENAPAGTRIKVLIDSKQFSSQPVNGQQYQVLSYSTTIANDGTYKIQVPALNKGVEVTIVADQFTYNQRYKDRYDYTNNKWIVATKREVYSAYEIETTVMPDMTNIQDFSYRIDD